ncbi:MAG TPA: recombinase RecT, partial [Methanocorpusculum sp.]|nr:recombinase RecT [Methanocorpusculum sp.]
MTSECIPNADLQIFPPAEIEQARVALGQPNLDESTVIRALIIQRDTGLSMSRGEQSIVPFNGRPTVTINRQGYLAYASRQPHYDGYESGIGTSDGELFAWCRVYNKNISHPVMVRIYQKEYAKTTPVWKEKPRYMLEETAISLALRAVFPILNGTCTEDEIEADAPVRIQTIPADITVSPEPVRAKGASCVPPRAPGTTACGTLLPEPEKQPAVHDPNCQTVTMEEVDMRYLPVYRRQKLDPGVFADADLG